MVDNLDGTGTPSRRERRPVTVRGRDVLAAILDGCSGLLELRALPSRVRTFVVPADSAALVAFATQHRSEHVYFGVASRRDASSGELDNCAALGAVYVDLDSHSDAQALAEGEARLAAFPLLPSIVIRSGGGLHAYWLLREPADVQAEASELRSVLRQLAHTLGGDLAAAECARVLRLPGTFNQKYDPPVPVTIHTFEPDRRYNLADFEFLPNEPVVTTSRTDGLDLSTIAAGGRNTTLYRLGRALRAKQLPGPAIVEALRAANATCRPAPLDACELEAIIRSVLSQPDRADFVPDVEVEATAPTHGTRRAVLTRVADIAAKEVDWLWFQRKARGLLNLTVGDPGLGKTFLTLDMAARISRGSYWPDGGRAPLGDVILLSAEDHPAFTLRGGDR
jgi:hypothetical protein